MDTVARRKTPSMALPKLAVAGPWGAPTVGFKSVRAVRATLYFGCNHMPNLCWAWCLIILCLFAVGCEKEGPPLGTVTGIVTLDGEPVENAFVTFMPLFQGGTESTGADKTDANGYYELQYDSDRMGALVGKHQVQISTQDWQKQPDGSNIVVKERIPSQYIGPDSILEFEVVEGKNEANFELTKKRPK